MRIQTFHLRKFFHGRQRFFERGAVVFHHAGAALELVHGQAGKGRTRAAGRQRVARAGDVIAQHRRRPRAEENRARRQDFLGNLARIARHHFAMFRRDLIGQRDRLVERLYLDQPAIALQRALDEFAPRQFRQLPRDFVFDRLQNFRRGGHEPDAFVAGTVLGLRQHVGGDEFGIGRVVGQHQHFARTGQQINGHVAEQQSFGRDHVGVARTENLLHPANGFRAISHRRDRLRAADAINLRRARRARGKQQRGIDAAIFAAGSAGLGTGLGMRPRKIVRSIR